MYESLHQKPLTDSQETLLYDLWQGAGFAEGETSAYHNKRKNTFENGAYNGLIGKSYDPPIDARESFLWGCGYEAGEDYRDSHEPCSLCGWPTEHERGSIRADWYLCADCEGTEEAKKAGFCH